MSSAATPDLPPYDEAAIFDELVFALGQRDQPTVALIECASLAKRRELEAQMAERMPEYQFRVLDVTPYQVTSLLQTLNEHLPEEVKASKPVTWAVHVHGLENSRLLSQDGQLVPSPLIAQLNLERELLFRSVPYLIVLWSDADFFRTLQREAPDFWHWVTYRFRFEDHTARPVAELPPLPPERLPSRGNVAERQARIKELQDRYDHLALDDSDKKRLLKDKIDILSLLGEEYVEAFLYDEAEESFEKAIALHERMREHEGARGGLWYKLGSAYLRHEKLSQSLDAFEESRKLLPKENEPALLHQIGRINAARKAWDLALEAYHSALQGWEGPMKEVHQSLTYFNIGRVYEEQQQWELALHNYQLAIDIGVTAYSWPTVGESYYQIGRVYEQQMAWSLAIKNYQTALYLQRQEDSFHQGGTCYQLGRVHEAQNQIAEAFSWYGLAVEDLTKYGHPLLGQAQKSFTRTMHLL